MSKLIRMGGSSYVVVLPRDWIRGQALDLKDDEEVLITYGDEEITIRPNRGSVRR